MYSPEIMQAITDAPVATKSILVFNKQSGAFIFNVANVSISDLSPDEFVTYVEADFNPNEHAIVGTYPEYKIVNKSELPEDIYESAIDNLMATKITKRYPVVEQVNVLGRALLILAEKSGVVLDELEEMLDYIQLARDTNREHKAAYRDDPAFNLITNEQIDANNDQLFAGGLHEAIGPREVQGGRVFH